MPTSNPTLNPRYFDAEAMTHPSSSVMTVRGAATKALLLTVITAAVAVVSWMQVFPNGMSLSDGAVAVDRTPMMIALLGGMFGGFILSLIICFRPKTAPYLAPVYAVFEGAFLGAISGIYTVQAYPGIVPQALMATFGTLGVMLTLWITGIIVMSNKLRSGIIGATCAVAVLYLVSFVASLFGANMSFLYGNGIVSIGISVVIVIIAALNLLLDFETIQNGARARAPKYMEWFAAFGLLVTLIWLYLEILRLLAKLSNRR